MFHKCPRFVRSFFKPKEWDLMVKYLAETLPNKDLLQVYEEIQKDPNWVYLQHHFYGMFIRNHLREGGFNLNPITLDDIWSDLLYQAAILIRQSRL